MRPTEIAALSSQLEIVKSKICQIEGDSRELMDVLSSPTPGVNFTAKILEITDLLQRAASTVDSELEAVEAKLPRQQELETLEERKAFALQALERANAMEAPLEVPQDLEGVLEFVRSVSDLSVQCCTYDSQPFSLLDDPQIRYGVDAVEASEAVLEVPNVFRAHVSLDATAGHSPLAVAVYGADEQKGLKDAFGSSDFIVFRRISAIADQALTFFRRQQQESPHPAMSTLLSLLLWLCTYRRLFEDECSILHSVVAFDAVTLSLIPPVFRPFTLDQSALVKAASSCRAYHLHAIPEQVL